MHDLEMIGAGGCVGDPYEEGWDYQGLWSGDGVEIAKAAASCRTSRGDEAGRSCGRGARENGVGNARIDLKIGNYRGESRCLAEARHLQRRAEGPDAGDGGVAVRAIPCPEAVGEDIMPGAADEEGVAGGAIGVGGFGEDVAFVDEVEANFAGNFARTMERVRRSGGLVAKLEIGMEGGEVEGDVGAEMREDPFGELAGFGGIVVERGDNEIGELEPHAGFVFEPGEHVQHGLKMSESDFAVEVFGEGFEVDVGGVNVVVDVVEGFAGDVTVGDHDGFEAVELGGFADVNDVFAPDGGFVVGEGDGIAAVLLGEERNLLGRKVLGIDLILMGFGDVPILAEEAAHVAPGGAYAEDARAGKEMTEGLFLDGIDLESGGGGVAEAEEFAALIDADETEARLAGTDVAMARTEVAVETAIGIGRPPEGFVEGGGFLEDLQV